MWNKIKKVLLFVFNITKETAKKDIIRNINELPNTISIKAAKAKLIKIIEEV